MRSLPTGIKRATKHKSTSLAGYIGGVSSFDLSRTLGHPETRHADSIYVWRLEVNDPELISKPFYIDIYDYNVKDEYPETPIEDVFLWNIASDYKYGALYILQKLFPHALVTRDFWKAFEFGEKKFGHKTVAKTKQKAAAVSDKQRKLNALRDKKAQLRDKKKDASKRLDQQIDQVEDQIRQVKYDNKKPTRKPKRPNKPKSYT